eukprot:60080-Prymnesium_polylepis.2
MRVGSCSWSTCNTSAVEREVSAVAPWEGVHGLIGPASYDSSLPKRTACTIAVGLVTRLLGHVTPSTPPSAPRTHSTAKWDCFAFRLHPRAPYLRRRRCAQHGAVRRPKLSPFAGPFACVMAAPQTTPRTQMARTQMARTQCSPAGRSEPTRGASDGDAHTGEVEPAHDLHPVAHQLG